VSRGAAVRRPTTPRIYEPHELYEPTNPTNPPNLTIPYQITLNAIWPIRPAADSVIRPKLAVLLALVVTVVKLT